MSCVIILGAGASYGTLGEKAPTSDKFGEYLAEEYSIWTNDYPYLAAAIRFLQRRIPETSEKAWALDRVWGALDNRYKLRNILDNSLPSVPFPPPKRKEFYKIDLDAIGLASLELLCAVAKVYGVALETSIQNATRGNGTLKREIEQLKLGDCIISFNYDLLAEKILEELRGKILITNSLTEIENLSDTILLCKPHGSLNWKRWAPERGKAVEILDHPMSENEIDFNSAIAATEQPAITAPIPFKSDIIFPEYQAEHARNYYHLLIAQWHFAIRRISEAEKLVVLGYGFPHEDQYAHYLFAESYAIRKNKKELKVEVYEKSENYKKVKKEIIDIFKIRPELCAYKGPVKP